MYKNIIKPILFLFSPDFVHSATVAVGRVVQALPPARWALKKAWSHHDGKLTQTVLGLEFTNPIGLSAGFDKNGQVAPLMESVGFGFETIGSVTLAPRKGNERPWFYRLPKSRSIAVHVGLANRGIATIARSLRRTQKSVRLMQKVISVAVVAKTAQETNQDAIIDAKNTTLYILQRKLAAMVEINISCPNAGDDQPFLDPGLLDELLGELDKIERTVPFFVKMPNSSSIRQFDALLAVVVRHNIQGVTIANLVKDRESIKLRDELPVDVHGGLSGMPARARSTALIRRTYEKYGSRLVIIGVGGVFCADHAYEKIRAGASLVGMITGVIFEGPHIVGAINKRLVTLLESDGLSSVTEAVGADYRDLRKKVSKK